MKTWKRIRHERDDLTDYVVHLTKPRNGVPALAVLLEILRAGHIRPTFAPMGNRQSRTPRNTVKGPHPAVCLSEQPLWAILKMRAVVPGLYSGHGVAYHKHHLYAAGGRPVLYGSDREIGRRLKQGESGWEEGKDIFTGGLPPELQYLWVNYYPQCPSVETAPVDFTWEREWRRKGRSLAVIAPADQWYDAKGAILVERDQDIALVESCLRSLTARDLRWDYHGRRIASLETARRKLDEGDSRYARLDTWPFPKLSEEETQIHAAPF